MRAGLLSDPKVIAQLNKRFISTTILIDDLEKQAKAGDEFAKRVAAEWEYPVEFVFITPEGKPLSRLNSFKDFPGMHPDVSAPPGKEHRPTNETHSDRFLNTISRHFGKE